jgi:hypothetical protein
MITIIPKNPSDAFSTPGIEFTSRVNTNPTGKSSVVQIDITPIPESFFRGLADCENGRVVDMDRAMDEKPPEIN